MGSSTTSPAALRTRAISGQWKVQIRVVNCCFPLQYSVLIPHSHANNRQRKRCAAASVVSIPQGARGPRLGRLPPGRVDKQGLFLYLFLSVCLSLCWSSASCFVILPTFAVLMCDSRLCGLSVRLTMSGSASFCQSYDGYDCSILSLSLSLSFSLSPSPFPTLFPTFHKSDH